MKANFTSLLLIIATLLGCQPKPAGEPLVGTWQLVRATATERDSTYSTFQTDHTMLKIVNATHFAFLNHPTDSTKRSTSNYTAGGGRYTLVDSVYTEHLDYFTDKAWEGHLFRFMVNVAGDTLTQTGTEKLEKLGIDRVIVETYRRVK